jgi:hypothetical protein
LGPLRSRTGLSELQEEERNLFGFYVFNGDGYFFLIKENNPQKMLAEGIYKRMYEWVPWNSPSSHGQIAKLLIGKGQALLLIINSHGSRKRFYPSNHQSLAARELQTPSLPSSTQNSLPILSTMHQAI